LPPSPQDILTLRERAVVSMYPPPKGRRSASVVTLYIPARVGLGLYTGTGTRPDFEPTGTTLQYSSDQGATIEWGGIMFTKDTGSVDHLYSALVTSIPAVTVPSSGSLIAVTIGNTVGTIGDNAFYECYVLASVTFASPSSLETIGYEAFQDCTTLTSIVIPASVVTIGEDAFVYCYDLASITFEAGSRLESIGESAFYGTALTSIVIPASVETIGPEAFYECYDLETVTFTEGSLLQTIGDFAFRDTALTSIEIPASVETIGESVFSNCDVLASVTFASGSLLGSIGDGAFDSTALQSIEIPASVTSIGVNAFQECDVLESVTFAAGSLLGSIGSAAFSYTALTSIEIPALVTSIGEYAFVDCDDLASVTFASGSLLGSIGDFAFYDTAITSIEIPALVTSIGEHAFEESGLTTVFIANDQLPNIPSPATGVSFYGATVETIYRLTTILQYSSDEGATIEWDGITFTKDTGSSDHLYSALVTSIPAVTLVPSTGLVAVTIGNTVETIGANAFSGCDVLETVTFASPSSLETIGDSAFEYCESLTSIVIPASVVTIGNNAFYDSGLTTVFIANDQLPNIPSPATGVSFYGATVETIYRPTTILQYSSDQGPIIEWGGTTFTKNENLSGYSYTAVVTSIPAVTLSPVVDLVAVTIGNTVVTIGEQAFYDCEDLVSVTFASPSSLLTIGDSAFQYSGLTSIEIPASVITIDEDAFYECYDLETVTFEAGSRLESIGEWAFYDCDALTSIVIPASVETIDYYAFYGCLDLASVTFAAGSRLETIDDGAFDNCEALTSIIIPASVVTIGESAFEDCYNLETVTFASPSSLESIDQYAFRDTALTSIVIPASVASIDPGVFTNSGLTTVFIADEQLPGIPSPANGVWFFGRTVETCIAPLTILRYISDQGPAVDWSGVTFTINENLSDYSYTASVTVTPSVNVPSSTDLISVRIGSVVTSIGINAFHNCTSLQTVTFTEPSSLETIGYAFENCTSLTSIVIPASVTRIENDAFSGCDVLESVTFAAGSLLETIDEYAFYSTAVTSIVIPASVTFIGEDAFDNSGLTTVIIENGQLSGIPSPATGVSFFGAVVTTFIRSPTILQYSSDQGPGIVWSGVTFTKNTNLPNHSYTAIVTSIPGGRVPFSSNLLGVTIGNVVTRIRGGAFYNCTSLETVTFTEPSSLETIGNGAFDSCEVLTSIQIPASVRSIGKYSFIFCYDLASITFEAGSRLESIGEEAFYDCDALTSIVIPASVISIRDLAFYSCDILETVTFAAGSLLENIGNNAFENCNLLTSIAIPPLVTTIGDSAFQESDLTTATMSPATATALSITLPYTGPFRGAPSVTITEA